jgi:S-adenosylmethionine hydrolase
MAAGKRCLVTLTTDFGIGDGTVGMMKGVILGINPDASIVDLTHNLPPQAIHPAAYVLRRAYQYFPPGTIHVVVVDPGVGTDRRPIALQAPHVSFVAPDNGALTYVLDHLQAGGHPLRLLHLDDPTYWLPQVSNVFHGRDIFAPVAAHLSLGTSIEDLGSPIDDPVRLPAPHLSRQPGKITGQVMYVDHFGNLLTNIPAPHLSSLGNSVTTSVGRTQIRGLSPTFAQGAPGKPIAYIDSSGHLAIAAVNASARDLLESHVGDQVEVTSQHPTPSSGGGFCD